MIIELHTLSGAYAIDALSEEETVDFRTHLAECFVCREEVQELRDVAARMGASQAVTPPAALKARILSAADRIVQLRPSVPLKMTSATKHSSTSSVTSIESARRRSWVPKVGAAAAAAVVAVGAAVGVSQMGDDEVPLAAPVSQVFEASDARTAEVRTQHGVVRVATSPGRGEMAVDASDLEPLDDGQVYQIWSIAEAEPTSVDVLDGETMGAAMDMPPTGTQVAITVEPPGGSIKPTTDPIVTVDPAAV